MVTTAKEIVPNITANLEMIASVRTTFIAATKHNVAQMSKHIVDLQNRLYTYERKASSAEQERRREEEENIALRLVHSSTT